MPHDVPTDTTNVCQAGESHYEQINGLVISLKGDISELSSNINSVYNYIQFDNKKCDYIPFQKRIDALEKIIELCREFAEGQIKGSHEHTSWCGYYDEDDGVCSCGVNEHNFKVELLLQQLKYGK